MSDLKVSGLPLRDYFYTLSVAANTDGVTSHWHAIGVVPLSPDYTRYTACLGAIGDLRKAYPDIPEAVSVTGFTLDLNQLPT